MSALLQEVKRVAEQRCKLEAALILGATCPGAAGSIGGGAKAMAKMPGRSLCGSWGAKLVPSAGRARTRPMGDVVQHPRHQTFAEGAAPLTAALAVKGPVGVGARNVG